MERLNFSEFMNEFDQFERGTATGELFRAGQLLTAALGIAHSSVGIGYSDANSTRVVFSVLDTRSPEEMADWKLSTARSWAKRGSTHVPLELLDQFLASDSERSASRIWHEIAQAIDWADVGIWGPGRFAPTDHLTRTQAIAIAIRIISEELDLHAAFSFMTGANSDLDGLSPVMWIREFDYHGFDDLVFAINRYVAST